MDEEAIPGRDETWVRPLRDRVVPADAFSLSVAAKFRSASGNEFRGIVGVSTFGGVDVGSAAIVFDAGYVFVPSPSSCGSREGCARAAQRLGLTHDQLFPLHYQLLVPIEGVDRTIEGVFAYAEA